VTKGSYSKTANLHEPKIVVLRLPQIAMTAIAHRILQATDETLVGLTLPLGGQ
jgi:hypothetical protein